MGEEGGDRKSVFIDHLLELVVDGLVRLDRSGFVVLSCLGDPVLLLPTEGAVLSSLRVSLKKVAKSVREAPSDVPATGDLGFNFGDEFVFLRFDPFVFDLERREIFGDKGSDENALVAIPAEERIVGDDRSNGDEENVGNGEGPVLLINSARSKVDSVASVLDSCRFVIGETARSLAARSLAQSLESFDSSSELILDGRLRKISSKASRVDLLVPPEIPNPVN